MDIARSPLRCDRADAKTAVKAMDERSLRCEAGGGGKKMTVTVALPQRKGNASGGMAHGRQAVVATTNKAPGGEPGRREEG